MLRRLYDSRPVKGDNVKSGTKTLHFGELGKPESLMRASQSHARAVGWSLLTVLALLAASCSKPEPPAREPIHVIAPVYLIAELASAIGGDRVDAQWWVESGQSLDELVDTQERRNQARNANIVVTRGIMDPWTLEGSSNEYQSRRIIRLDQLPSSRDTDPRLYMWLDPSVALELIDELTDRISGLDPKNEKIFRKRAAELRAKVIALSDEARPIMDSARGGFMTLDRGFATLAKRFSLNEVTIEQINLSDPSPYGVKVLKQAAKESGARAIFVNAQTPSALLRDWEPRLELMVLTLDALGSSADSGRSTYMKVMEYNLQQLVKGMKASQPAATTSPATTTAATQSAK